MVLSKSVYWLVFMSFLMGLVPSLSADWYSNCSGKVKTEKQCRRCCKSENKRLGYLAQDARTGETKCVCVGLGA